MKWFLNLLTRTKLFLSFGLIIIFLGIVIVVAYTGIMSMQEAQKRLYEEDFANAVDLASLRLNQNGVRAAQLDMLIVDKRSDQEAWQQDIKDRSKEIDEIMK